MHPHPEFHRSIARDTEARRIAAARHASIGADRMRHSSSARPATGRGVLGRLAAAMQRRPAGETS